MKDKKTSVQVQILKMMNEKKMLLSFLQLTKMQILVEANIMGRKSNKTDLTESQS